MKTNLLFALLITFSISTFSQTLPDVMDGFIRGHETSFKDKDYSAKDKFGGTYADSKAMLKCKMTETEDRQSVIFFDISGLTEDAKSATLKLGYNGASVYTDKEDYLNIDEAEKKKVVVAVKSIDKFATGAELTPNGFGINTDYTVIDSITPTHADSGKYISFTHSGLADKINELRGAGKSHLCVVLYREATTDAITIHFHSAATPETTTPPVIEISSSSATQSITLSSVNIYPNPADDIVTIDQDFDVLNIIDVTGKVVKTATSGVSEINVSDLKAGLYFVKVESAGKVYCSKLMIK